MKILTNFNEAYDTDSCTNDVHDIWYATLDLSSPNKVDADFQFNNPLVFLESFNSPAIVMKIGSYKISIPYDWYIVIGDKDYGDLEILAIEDINDRAFTTPVLNPLTTFIPDYCNIEVETTYNEVRWFFPKLNPNNILVAPLLTGKNPPCCLLVNELVGKKLDKIPAELLYR
jgi:hypothetical protein